MASLIDFRSGTGLMDKLGKLFGGAQAIVTAQLALRTRRDTIAGEYTAAQYPWIQQTLALLDQRIIEMGNRLMDYRTDAQQTLIEMVNFYIPLQSLDLRTALVAMIADMITNEDIQGNTVSIGAAAAVGSPTGNGKAIGSLSTLDTAPALMQYVPADVFTIECIGVGDGQPNTIQTFSVKSNNEIDGLDPDWPGGSGVNQTISGLTAQSEQQTGYGLNLLRNGDMEDFAANLPDGWQATSGIAGTDFGPLGSGYIGSNALQLKNTSAVVQLDQATGNGAAYGTNGQFLAYTMYVLGLAAKRTGAGSGAFSVQGTGGGTHPQLSVAYADLTTSWAVLGGFSRSPRGPVENTGVKIVTAGVAGPTIEIDEIRICPVQPMTAGPYIAYLQGNTACALGDKWTITTTNNWGGLFAKWFERFFGLRRLGLVIPYAASSPSISDALVV